MLKEDDKRFKNYLSAEFLHQLYETEKPNCKADLEKFYSYTAAEEDIFEWWEANMHCMWERIGEWRWLYNQIESSDPNETVKGIMVSTCISHLERCGLLQSWPDFV